VDNIPRHPSQLYEFALEGVAFFLLLWIYSSRPRPVGAVSGMFLIGYGVFRSFAEFFREPEDGFMGVMTLGISMGQWLSLPMVIAGALMLNWAYRRERHTLSWQEPRKPDKPGSSTRSVTPGKRNRK
jgi:phosphatidylglycerol:prolipoprotein diacylglycerol transferase